MDMHSDPLSVSLCRVPGLFRRWELTDILKVHRTYRLEEAGTHADGSPLLAVYVGPVTEGPAGTETGPDDRGDSLSGEAG